MKIEPVSKKYKRKGEKKVRWGIVMEAKQKTIQLSCKVEGKKLNRFINELESLDSVRKKKSNNRFERGRYELDKCLIIAYTSGSIVYNPHKHYLNLLEKYSLEYEKEIMKLQEKK